MHDVHALHVTVALARPCRYLYAPVWQTLLSGFERADYE